MNDAACVRVIERVGHLGENAPNGIDGQTRLSRKASGETLAFDQRHDDVDDATALVDRIDRDDAGMTQLRGRLRLTQKACLDVGVEGQLRWQRLDRDMAMEPKVQRAEDSGHAAATDLGFYQILIAHRGDDAVIQIVSHDA